MGKNIFNSVQLEKPKKNVFDLSHDVKMSMKMGNLTPVLVTECVPGDSFQIGCDSLIRFAPMVAPVMHRMDVSVHYFFVPNRLVWDNWEKFIVDANTAHVLPYFSSEFLTPGQATNLPDAAKFADYMGVPTPANGSTHTNINAIPFAAYSAIYNEYYRDENLITEVDYKLTDGDNSTTYAQMQQFLTLRKRSWEHDYFTASLPFAQKGTAVDIPLGSVELDVTGTTSQLWKDDVTRTVPATGTISSVGAAGENYVGGSQGVFDPNGSLLVEPTTINDLRRAFRLQEWLEKNARGGTHQQQQENHKVTWQVMD